MGHGFHTLVNPSGATGMLIRPWKRWGFQDVHTSVPFIRAHRGPFLFLLFFHSHPEPRSRPAVPRISRAFLAPRCTLCSVFSLTGPRRIHRDCRVCSAGLRETVTRYVLPILRINYFFFVFLLFHFTFAPPTQMRRRVARINRDFSLLAPLD